MTNEEILKAELGFWIDNTEPRVIYWISSSGFRPANENEIALWDKLLFMAESRKAERDKLLQCMTLNTDTINDHIYETELQREKMFRFVEWINERMYVKYWGNDAPNCGKWYMGYTHPNRSYYTTAELFELFLKEEGGEG